MKDFSFSCLQQDQKMSHWGRPHFLLSCPDFPCLPKPHPWAALVGVPCQHPAPRGALGGLGVLREHVCPAGKPWGAAAVAVLQSVSQFHRGEHHQGKEPQSHGHRGHLRYGTGWPRSRAAFPGSHPGLRAAPLPPDPYVKVWLMYKDKRVEKKKTVVMKRCLNPVFNESFAFDIPTERLRETTIVITVMDKDRLSRNDVIGKVGDTPEGHPGGNWGQPGPGLPAPGAISSVECGVNPSCWVSWPQRAGALPERQGWRDGAQGWIPPPGITPRDGSGGIIHEITQFIISTMMTNERHNPHP